MPITSIDPQTKKPTNLLATLGPIAGTILGAGITLATGGLGAPLGIAAAGGGAATGAAAGAAAGAGLGGAAAGLGAGSLLAAGGKVLGNAMTGMNVGSTVGRTISPDSEAAPNQSAAMERRLSKPIAETEHSQALKDSIYALNNQNEEMRKTYEAPLTQAYLMAHLDQYSKKNNGGGGMV